MSVPDPLPRSLDAFDAYLFDIDGTLLECTDATHYFAFCEALRLLSGREMNLDGVLTHGNTDVGILRDALALGGVHEDAWRMRLPEAIALMGDFVERRQNDLRITVLPGVIEVLAHLRRRGAKVGVATGNLERIGKLKLANAGLLQFFDFAGWSDAFEYRTNVFQAAVRQAQTLCGSTKATVCALGDTPLDVRAAQDNAIAVIAVATGIFAFEELSAEQPTLCVQTLKDLLRP